MKCPFCGCPSHSATPFPRPTHYAGQTFHYRACSQCDLVFIDPMPSPEMLSLMYQPDYHESHYSAERIYPEPWTQKITSRIQNKVMLDYGCGDAAFLRFWRDQGYHGCGIEYSSDFVDKLSHHNPNLRFETVDSFWRDTTQWEAIHLGDVLEHLPTPITFLEDLRAKLVPGGLLYLDGPLENNPHLALAIRKALSRLKRGQTADHIPYHLTFANARNQLELLERLGFETLEYQVYETHWPYPDTPGDGLGQSLKFGAAALSMKISAAHNRGWGNRFRYLGILP